MKQIIFVVGLSLLFQSCLVSRTSRPKLTGYVFDMESLKPIARCSVGQSFTDSTGHYELEEMRYREFTWIGTEAPPVHVFEIVEKTGYFTDSIRGFNRYGGALTKGAHWEMDTIFLKKKPID